jgi:hypothetical protein
VGVGNAQRAEPRASDQPDDLVRGNEVPLALGRPVGDGLEQSIELLAAQPWDGEGRCGRVNW